MAESFSNNGTATASLKEARDKLRLLRMQRETRRLEAEMHVLESWGLYTGYTGNMWGSFVDPNDSMRDPDLWDGALGSPLPGRRDLFANSQPGILWPIIRNEMDFDTMRASARILADVNDLAKGILCRLRNFTIRTGFTYQALAKAKLRAEEARIAQILADQVQFADDEFCELNQWADREKESGIRKWRDGEYFHRLFRPDPERGITVVRFVEPEQVRRPMGSPPEWSWGIHTDPDDIESIISYAVEYRGDSIDWHDVAADEIIHGKANVDRTIKRGISDFYCTREGLEGIRKLRRALRVGAAMQASIPWIEQYDVARQTAVQAGVNAMIDQLQPQVNNPFSGKPMNMKQYLPGQVLHIGHGKQYLPAPVAEATNNIHIAIGQYDVRSIGARWDMPEYMIGGDASNNNFASILVAGAPFVIAVETEQDSLKKNFLQVHWAAIKNYADAGRFRIDGRVFTFDEIKRLVDLHCTPPQVAIANRLEEAQIDYLDMRAGVLSKQTRREKLGLDNDKETANIEKDPMMQQSSATTPAGDASASIDSSAKTFSGLSRPVPNLATEAETQADEIDSFFLSPKRRIAELSDPKHALED